MTNLSAKWIWYANDFELLAYHKMIKKRRQRQDLIYPTWIMDRPEYQVTFLGHYNVPEKTSFKIYHNGQITVNVNDKPWFVENPDGIIELEPGQGTIRIYCMAETGLPCVFIDSKYVKTNESWQAYCVDNKLKNASANNMFTTKDYGPMDYKLPTKKLKCKSIKKVSGGLLYDFGRELLAIPVIKATADTVIHLYYGESDIEAIDYKNSEVCEDIKVVKDKTTVGEESRGFRYVYIKNPKTVSDFYVLEELYVTDFESQFKSNSALMNKIYSTAKYTLKLTSREMFIDGPKRDRWTWAGDVLQSMWFDFYTFFDKEIVKRTLSAIIGKQEIRSNMSGILDYNFYYVISVYYYYVFTGDLDFIKTIFPRLQSMMRFIFTKPKVNGLLMANNEWIFIDWTNIKDFGKLNNTYPISLIQMLYYKSLEIMISFEDLLGIEHDPKYLKEIDGLKQKISDTYYDSEKGLYYHDTAHTTKTKYGNIFALLLGIADESQRQMIAKGIVSDEVHEIHTPFMKFFELCALAEVGHLEYVLDYMQYYWGGMIKHGATTFWERFDPDQTGNEKYAMYGRPYGKSLCHSWGAGPLYIIGKYIVGLSPLEDGYEQYKLQPYLGKLKLKTKLPMNNSELDYEYNGEYIKIFSPNKDGVLAFNVKLDCSDLTYSEEKGGYILKGGQEYTIKIKEDK